MCLFLYLLMYGEIQTSTDTILAQGEFFKLDITGLPFFELIMPPIPHRQPFISICHRTRTRIVLDTLHEEHINYV